MVAFHLCPLRVPLPAHRWTVDVRRGQEPYCVIVAEGVHAEGGKLRKVPY